MIANFALTRLVIRKDDRWNRNVLRILKQGEQYQFNGYGDECGSLERDFFAAGVTISAIVGKNGSGKSSLLDLTYRMFNNLGYCLRRSLKHKPTEPHLGFVPDLYADLDFVVTDPKTDVKTYCCIHNYGDTVAFEYGKEKFKRITRTSLPVMSRLKALPGKNWANCPTVCSILLSLIIPCKRSCRMNTRQTARSGYRIMNRY